MVDKTKQFKSYMSHTNSYGLLSINALGKKNSCTLGDLHEYEQNSNNTSQI